MKNDGLGEQGTAQQLDKLFPPRPQLAVEQALADLPQDTIVEQGLRIQRDTTAERDALRREVSGLKNDIAGYKVAIEAMQTQLADADSRMQTMTVVRDEAVRRQAEVETVLASMLALGRAFSIKSKPHITGTGDQDEERS